MRVLTALIRRELGAYFISPTAYVILTAFLVISGSMFHRNMLFYAAEKSPANFSDLQYGLVFLLNLICPALTMRLLAEEKNRGTIETMMTAPVGEWSFVLSKYLASLLFVAYLVLPTAFYTAFVASYGTLDVTGTIVGYLGVLLTAGALLSIGLFISALANSQITAGVVTLIVSFGLMLTSFFSSSLKGDTAFVAIARRVLERVGLLEHVIEFAHGVIDLRPLVYLSSVAVFFLFLTVRAVESRRWR
jgi:ABC-2 type transport system permease protein